MRRLLLALALLAVVIDFSPRHASAGDGWGFGYDSIEGCVVYDEAFYHMSPEDARRACTAWWANVQFVRRARVSLPLADVFIPAMPSVLPKALHHSAMDWVERLKDMLARGEEPALPRGWRIRAFAGKSNLARKVVVVIQNAVGETYMVVFRDGRFVTHFPVEADDPWMYAWRCAVKRDHLRIVPVKSVSKWLR